MNRSPASGLLPNMARKAGALAKRERNCSGCACICCVKARIMGDSNSCIMDCVDMAELLGLLKSSGIPHGLLVAGPDNPEVELEDELGGGVAEDAAAAPLLVPRLD